MYTRIKNSNMTIIFVLFIILIAVLGFKYQECYTLKHQLAEVKLQEAPLPAEPVNTVITINEPYTMITNLESHLYMESITVDMSKAHSWTDINGVSGFDIYDNGCMIRYVKGHVMPDQMHWYAPYAG